MRRGADVMKCKQRRGPCADLEGSFLLLSTLLLLLPLCTKTTEIEATYSLDHTTVDEYMSEPPSRLLLQPAQSRWNAVRKLNISLILYKSRLPRYLPSTPLSQSQKEVSMSLTVNGHHCWATARLPFINIKELHAFIFVNGVGSLDHVGRCSLAHGQSQSSWKRPFVADVTGVEESLGSFGVRSRTEAGNGFA